jgi:hypothetical protein
MVRATLAEWDEWPPPDSCVPTSVSRFDTTPPDPYNAFFRSPALPVLRGRTLCTQWCQPVASNIGCRKAT